MADLLALSTRIIDEGVLDEPTNRVTQQLSELANDLAVVESFSHVVTFSTPFSTPTATSTTWVARVHSSPTRPPTGIPCRESSVTRTFRTA
jgi:hypothetical protein